MRNLGIALLLVALLMGFWYGFATPLGGVIFQLHPPLLNTMQAGLQRNLAPWLWNDIIQPLLVQPNGLVPGLLGLLFLLLGLRRKRHA